MDDLLQQGITAYKAGKREEARKLFITFIKQNPESERGWGWMYDTSGDDKERIYCLKQMLRINPKNEKANQLLNQLLAPPSFSSNPSLTSIPSSPEIAVKKGDNKPVVQTKEKKQSRVVLVVLGVLGFICVCGIAFLSFPYLISPAPSSSAPNSSSTAPQSEYILELIAMDDVREYDYITVNGQVKNISLDKLESIEVVIEFYDANGNFVKSDSALIDYNPILPGQTSPFSVIATDNPAIKRYSATFKYFFGGTISTKDSR